jgi:putative aldouronate transport system substrate-binding protein
MKFTKPLGVVAALALLVGCSGGSDENDASKDVGFRAEGLPIVTEHLTLTFSGEKAPLAPEYDQLSLVKQWEQDTNIAIKWENLPTSTYQEKKNLLLAAGDLPDAFYNSGLTDVEIASQGAKGTLIPLEDLIEEHAPNLAAIFEKRPDIRAALTAPDGHIYSLPKIEELGLGAVPFFWSINKAWLDKLGLELPTTIEEYEEVLRAFKTQDPNGNGKADEIPLSFINDWWCADAGDIFAAISGMPDNPDHRIVRDDTVIYTAAQEEYRDSIAQLHEWYADGLIDPEVFTQTDAQYLAKGQSNPDVLGSFVWWETEEVVGTDSAGDYVLLPPLEGPAGQLVGRSNLSDIGRNGFSITRANEYPAATMRWVDRLYDPVMSAQVSWGPIGEGLEENADGVLTSILDAEDAAAGERRQKIAPDGPRAILADDFGTVVEPEPRAAQRLEDLQKVYLPYLEEQNLPPMYMTEDELDQLATLEADISTLVDEKRAEWIVRGGVEEEWDEYVSQLESMGLDDYVAVYQSAYDRYLEAQ